MRTLSRLFIALSLIGLAATGCVATHGIAPSTTAENNTTFAPAPAYTADAASPVAAAPTSSPSPTPAAKEKKKKKKVWEGIVEAALSATGGNARTRDIDARAQVKATWEKDRFMAHARTEWGENQVTDSTGKKKMERNRNRQTLGVKWEHDFHERLYGFVMQDFEKDEFQDLRLRSTTAAGAGYKILDEEVHKLSTDAGLGYERNDFYEDENRDNMIGTFGENWEWKISEAWKFVQTFSFISNLKDYDTDFRTATTADLRNQLTKSIFLSVGLEHRYNAQPGREANGDRTKRQDWLAMVKLGWTF